MTADHCGTDRRLRLFAVCLESDALPARLSVLGMGAFCGCASSRSRASRGRRGSGGIRRIGRSCRPLCAIAFASGVCRSWRSSSSTRARSCTRRRSARRFAGWSFCDDRLRGLVVPRSVESIGKFCFHVCQALIAVTFEENWRLRVIHEDAFSCTGLTEIVAPGTVQCIHRDARDTCKLLSTVHFESGSAL
jgi:hypothetical protein